MPKSYCCVPGATFSKELRKSKVKDEILNIYKIIKYHLKLRYKLILYRKHSYLTIQNKKLPTLLMHPYNIKS